MRKDIFISLILHITLFISLFFLPGSARQKEYPTVYRVGLVTFPKRAVTKGAGKEGTGSQIKTESKKAEEGVALKQVKKKEEKKTPKKDTKKSTEKKNNGKDKKDGKDKNEKASEKEGDGKGKEGKDSQIKEGVGSAEFEGLSGVGVDFGGSYYVDIMRAKIGEFWRNPIRGATSVVRTTIYFKIEKNGKIKDAIIEKSSGIELFDQAALRSVLSADPLPSLPQEYTGDILGVHLEFEYMP